MSGLFRRLSKFAPAILVGFFISQYAIAEQEPPRYFCSDPLSENFEIIDSSGATLYFSCQDFQIALDFVSKSGNNKNFSIFLSQGAALTQTIQGLSAKYGIEEVLTFVKFEVLKAMARHGKIWDQNLAIAHLRYFSAEELNSILMLKRESPFFDDYLAKQGEIGAAMKEMSEPILLLALEEILLTTFEHFTKE